MNILQNTFLHKSFLALALAGLLLFTASCEIVKSDVKKDFTLDKVDAYKIQGGNFAIDLGAAFPNSRYLGVRDNTSANFNIVDEDGGKFLVYQPKNGVDEEFDIELETNTGGTRVASVQFQNRSLTECGNAENFTEATISNDSKLVVDLFENEDFCGLKDLSSVAIKTPEINVDSSAYEYSDLHTGAMPGDINGEGGKRDWLTYTFDPADDFTGVVEVEYVAAVNWDSEASDTLSTLELLNHPEVSEFHTRHTARITVTD